MKARIAGLVAAVMLLGACDADTPQPTAGPSPNATPRSTAGPTPPTASEQRTIAIYSAVVRRLITKDHTFGGGPSPFDHLFIVDGAVKKAGDPMEQRRPTQPFSHAIKRGLRQNLADLPTMDFVSNPDSARLGKRGLNGVRDNGVIITLAPIEGDGLKVEVPNSLWCGGLCGQWLTYVVKLEDERWRVTGQTGPYAIS
jgi:hypothetical protein